MSSILDTAKEIHLLFNKHSIKYAIFEIDQGYQIEHFVYDRLYPNKFKFGEIGKEISTYEINELGNII